jgi:STE24 endopeptidase
MSVAHIELHALLIAFIVGTQLILTGLAVLNIRHSDREVRKRSEWLQESLGIENPDRNLDYLRANTGTSLLQSWVTLGLLLLILYSGLYETVMQTAADTGIPSVAAGIGVFVGTVLALQAISIPFELFSTFVIEEIFDFNEQTLGIWLRDKSIMLSISTILVAAIGGGLLLSIQFVGQFWWLAGIAIVTAVLLVMMVVLPEVIMPLMYDFEPIDEGELRESVDSVFEKAGFSCDGIYEMEMSSHTSKSNAMFMGFGPAKRVALGDTLIDNHTLPEVESVIAHELAHYKRKHVWKGLGASILQFGLIFLLLGFLIETTWLYEMFGLPADATYAGLVTGMLWLWPLQLVTTPLNNRLSIRHEYEADAFAVQTTGNPEAEVSSLAKLGDENLSNPFPHPWYEAFHYDHPPIPKRIKAVEDEFGDEQTDDSPGTEAATT